MTSRSSHGASRSASAREDERCDARVSSPVLRRGVCSRWAMVMMAMCSLGYDDSREDEASRQGDDVVIRGEPLRLLIQARVSDLSLVNHPDVSLRLETTMTNTSSVDSAEVLLELRDESGGLVASNTVALKPGEASDHGRFFHVIDCGEACEHDYVVSMDADSEHPLRVNWSVDLVAIGSPRHGCFTSREARPSVSLEVSAD